MIDQTFYTQMTSYNSPSYVNSGVVSIVSILMKIDQPHYNGIKLFVGWASQSCQ